MALNRKVARANKAKATAKFATLAVMNRMIDGGEAGVAKVKRRMNDNWTKRQSNNVTGFYDPKKAKVQVCS